MFMLPRPRAFEQLMTCPSAAKKSCGSHLLGVRPGEADKTALVQELSKAITFLTKNNYKQTNKGGKLFAAEAQKFR